MHNVYVIDNMYHIMYNIQYNRLPLSQQFRQGYWFSIINKKQINRLLQYQCSSLI